MEKPKADDVELEHKLHVSEARWRAHEVKNPLAGIRGAIQVIGSRLPAGSADVPITREIVARIDELSDMIRDLLLFSRPPQPHFGPVDLVTLIKTTAELFGRRRRPQPDQRGGVGSNGSQAERGRGAA